MNNSPRFKSSVTPEELKSQAALATSNAEKAAAEAKLLNQRLEAHQFAFGRLTQARDRLATLLGDAQSTLQRLHSKIDELVKGHPDVISNALQWQNTATFIVQLKGSVSECENCITVLEERVKAAEKDIDDFLSKDAFAESDVFIQRTRDEAVQFSKDLRATILQ